jgi:hypothetical protein
VRSWLFWREKSPLQVFAPTKEAKASLATSAIAPKNFVNVTAKDCSFINLTIFPVLKAYKPPI